jgi:hypothetical protein
VKVFEWEYGAGKEETIGNPAVSNNTKNFCMLKFSFRLARLEFQSQPVKCCDRFAGPKLLRFTRKIDAIPLEIKMA